MAANSAKTITKTIVTNTSAYASGDFLGTGILTLSDATVVDGALLHAITVTDLDKQNAAMAFLFFTSACANTTFTNNGALTLHDTDLLTFIGHVSIDSTNYVSLADNSVATKSLAGVGFDSATNGKDLYCVPVCLGTPTYSASGLQAKFFFVRL